MPGRGRGKKKGYTPPSGAQLFLRRSLDECGLSGHTIRSVQDITRPALFPNIRLHSSGDQRMLVVEQQQQIQKEEEEKVAAAAAAAAAAVGGAVWPAISSTLTGTSAASFCAVTAAAAAAAAAVAAAAAPSPRGMTEYAPGVERARRLSSEVLCPRRGPLLPLVSTVSSFVEAAA
mmetsp:Transcript_2561/g.5914  ORF Transcript_2561/g.5914 Transcript_2561/m.5914 type:complete len:175 (-) Transcript_2561:1036-1560(-)